MQQPMSSSRIALSTAGALGTTEMSTALSRFLEPDAPEVPWWAYPGARSWLALQPTMTPAKVEALVALAGRTDETTLAEVARRHQTYPAQLLRWHLAADRLMRRWLARMLDDLTLPPRRPSLTVQDLRERRALSMQALAKRARVSLCTAFRASHGLPLRPGSKQRLAAALGVSPEQIKWEA